ncbi:MAG: polyphosphate kinase 1 [Planctomycetaceae bacterium]
MAPLVPKPRKSQALAIGPEHFVNRELSWLEFNARVLEEAEDAGNLLLERLKFLSIFSGNLDEFMMVRVSGLREQMQGLAEPEDRMPEALSLHDQFLQVHDRTHRLVERQYRCLRDQVLPGLAQAGIRLLDPDSLPAEHQQHLNTFFQQTVFPVLTPVAIDPSHPTPHLRSRGLYLAAMIDQASYRTASTNRLLAVVHLPPVLPRLIRLPGDADSFVLLEQLVGTRLEQLFSGSSIVCWTTIRITRDADLDIDGDQALQDLSQAVEEGLKQLRHRDVVRLEVAPGADATLVAAVCRPLGLMPGELYEVDGPLDLTVFNEWQSLPGYPHLHDEPFTPKRPVGLGEGANFFETIRQRDVLIHHPYESFGCVTEFLQQAAEDPDVLAIKQTLYRAGSESPIIRALIAAADKGKSVTAVVELLARFDEQSNVKWARQMERAGVHVVYGFVDRKTHCKLTLVVRREADRIRRYVHLGTGNYNAATSRIYTDLGLFTARESFGEDASALFNYLTGYSTGYQWRQFTVSPDNLHDRVLQLIDAETEKARNRKPARIFAKLNQLVDPEVIAALYRASQAGVPVELVVRGSCCLRPGVAGLSETIRVTSILDRFLEHSRIYVFGAPPDEEVYLASADWMPRNFRRRVEIMFPVLEPTLKRRIVEGILPTLVQDTVKARLMQGDGTYTRVTPAIGQKPLRAQLQFLSDPPVPAYANEVPG